MGVLTQLMAVQNYSLINDTIFGSPISSTGKKINFLINY